MTFVPRPFASIRIAVAERMTLLVAVVLLVGLHLGNLVSAGAFWRDEVGDLAYANMASWARIWAMLKYDNFPPLLLGVLRAWHALGLAGDGTGYRVLGLLVGLGIIGVFWLDARLLGARTPFFSLALFAACRIAVRVGDSVRPYGLGWLFILLTFGLLWRVVIAPKTGRIALAALAAILAVQTLYQNAFLLLAMGLAGMAVAAGARRWRAVAAVAGIGIVAALSMLPLALGPVRDANAWGMVGRTGLPWGRMGETFNEAVTSSGAFVPWAWAVAVAGVAWAACTIRRIAVKQIAVSQLALTPESGAPATADDEPFPSREALMYAGSAALLAFPIFLGFLKFLGMHTMPWYYLPPLALAASALDVFGGRLAADARWRWARLVFFAVVLGSSLPTAWRDVQARATNVDLIAVAVGQAAAPGDLVVVCPWTYGVSFGYYYEGVAPWTTLPPLEDNTIHRYDLIKERIQAPAKSVAPVFQRVEQTLRAGGRVWVVGWIDAPEPGRHLLSLSPAPDPHIGWDESGYTVVWIYQLGDFLQTHAGSGVEIPATGGHWISGLENMQLYRAEGWRP